jgi:hypothetical protein
MYIQFFLIMAAASISLQGFQTRSEPSTMALFGLGVAAVLIFRRRK